MRPARATPVREGGPPNSSSREKRLRHKEILRVGLPISGQANSGEIWDCLVAAGGLIHNNINSNWCPHV
jgi:hypothetical protein